MRTLLLLTILAAPPAPKGPDRYEIDIRYRINAFRNERARQFLDFVAQLKGLGFERESRDAELGEDKNEVENTDMTRMKGTIPATSLSRVSRLRPVLEVLVRPAGSKLLVGDQPVRVQLELTGDLGPAQQRKVAAELATILEKKQIGFKQPVGYDNRNHTRLVGVLPANQLETLLLDVRRSPVSWSSLKPSLLSELRRSPGGPDSLRAILQTWYEDPEGSKLVQAALEAWAQQEPGYGFISGLHPLVVADSTLLRELKEAEVTRKPLGADTKARLTQLIQSNEVVREQVLLNLQRAEQSAPQLQALLEEVFRSKRGPDLMDVLLRRLEGRDASVVLPQLFRGRTVVRVIEARPDLPVPEPRLPTADVPEALQKIGPSLRELLKDAARADTPIPLEVLLTTAPDPGDSSWLRQLSNVVPQLLLEGRIGPAVAAVMKPTDAVKLAQLRVVSTVRLPREARPSVLTLPNEEGDTAEVLKTTGIGPLIRKGKPFRPVRVAVVDSDFRGWEPLVRKQLPFSTRYVDLTRDRNPNLLPDPFRGPADALGTGTLTAMAVAAASPWCELVLVRVDPAAPHQLNLLHRKLHDEGFVSPTLEYRRRDLEQSRAQLEKERGPLVSERIEVLKLYADNRQQDDPIADPFQKQKQQRVEAYRVKQAEFDRKEKAFLDLEKIYIRHVNDLRDLRDVKVVVCGLNWTDGYPVDGGSTLTRLLDETPKGKQIWFQAAGNARGQSWTGLFRDEDKNGVMDFATSSAPLPPGTWNHEANYLAWQPHKGERARLLPDKTRVRITMQWREAQDPESVRDGEDLYRKPLASLRLVVLRQLDPEGATRPADDLVVLTETQERELPARLSFEIGSSVYEHVLEFTVPANARLALRVEGEVPTSLRPPEAGDPFGPKTVGEIRPRLFIETLDGEGRVVMESYTSDSGEFGMPADSLRVVTVGALDAKGKPQPYTTEGSPFNMELTRKPVLRTFDQLGLAGAKSAGGSGMSAGLAAGYAASLLADGKEMDDLLGELRRRLRHDGK